MEVLNEIINLIVDDFRFIVVVLVAVVVVAGVYNTVEPHVEGQWEETLESTKSLFSTSIYMIIAISGIGAFLTLYDLFRRLSGV
jgi:hypothetical protein